MFKPQAGCEAGWLSRGSVRKPSPILWAFCLVPHCDPCPESIGVKFHVLAYHGKMHEISELDCPDWCRVLMHPRLLHHWFVPAVILPLCEFLFTSESFFAISSFQRLLFHSRRMGHFLFEGYSPAPKTPQGTSQQNLRRNPFEDGTIYVRSSKIIDQSNINPYRTI